jgi:hypothetical protein
MSSFTATIRPVAAGIPSGPTAIAVDMLPQATGAGLAEVVRDARPDHRVVKVDPIVDLTGYGDFVPLVDLVVAYADAVQATKPSLVVGHCQGATFAQALTRELQGCGLDPVLVLIDPIWTADMSVADELESLRAAVNAPGRLPAAAPPADPFAALGLIRAVVTDDLALVARAQGLPENMVDTLVEQLGARYLGWMSYVVSAATHRGPLATARLAIVVDDSEVAPAVRNSTEVRLVPANRAELLHDPRLARELASMSWEN